MEHVRPYWILYPARFVKLDPSVFRVGALQDRTPLVVGGSGAIVLPATIDEKGPGLEQSVAREVRTRYRAVALTGSVWLYAFAVKHANLVNVVHVVPLQD